MASLPDNQALPIHYLLGATSRRVFDILPMRLTTDSSSMDGSTTLPMQRAFIYEPSLRLRQYSYHNQSTETRFFPPVND